MRSPRRPPPHLALLDHRVRLLSSHTHPLSHHSALSLIPPPPTDILAAATHLRIGTTFDDPNPASSSASTRSALTVKVAVQDFAVCLVTEGGSAGVGTLVAGRKAGRRSGAFSPTPTEGESSPWIVVLELLVPWHSKPPLDRTAVSIRSSHSSLPTTVTKPDCMRPSRFLSPCRDACPTPSPSTSSFLLRQRATTTSTRL